ncbi:PREDICTED: solute carrier organic anion transporter family member 1B3 isoform X1 [Cercocebus atys]|uniref:Solute carrier organic anion transporter family member n=1 Tax=Cercocebus atys TaxID=9531 RepID=A0A2K5N0X8_CERAT|nr:PREDICTED: solute carrier organic anion transporter family member 1B3 isoform X1 [Cercocebus atys]XP_011913774.1 PREDICTED: solute carrier organic anion transporter family member 1B3 isoform X1 [Cercocebus atys]XP_011913775.1 PREDICTED: solute carrier organic anion transporter family member 1B3 isoform X1 [Cercocebus atys]
MDQHQHLNKTAESASSEKKKTRRCNGFKMFLAALSFSYIARALGGIIMKMSITQIERRFDISSSLAGLIDGSFEIGNLLVIVFVSYFGSKLHRPKLIGIGCLIMGTGSILTALPHFFMGYYRYSKETHINPSENSTSSLSTCLINQTLSFNRTSPEIVEKGCVKESGSHMWMYVFMGNMLRGIGETPIGPLGISYIDDFAKEGHSSLYVGSLNAIGMIGPVIGFILGSLFAKMYVDIGYVDLSTIRITPKDSRWVGAWWLGFLVSGLFSITSSIPFFFLPQNPNKPQEERKVSLSLHVLKTNDERSQTANLTNRGKKVTKNVTGFFQSLKSLLTNPLYVMFVLLTLLQISSFIGSFTYIFKYMEQQYGQSASQANFLLGVITIPTIATGMFLGGYIIKKFKLSLVGIAKFSLLTSIISFLFQLIYFPLICESKSVAGLTLTYDGNNSVASHIDVPLSYCNSECNCDESQWEPVCGNNGITYLSPCLAGCKSLSGIKKSTVFYNCSCVEVTGLRNRNYSAHLGECPRDDACTRKFYIYVAIQVINSLFSATGGTVCILLIVKIVQPELKALAMGFHSMVIRTLGGILAPIYFGALIDKTCMKWSTTSCGARGACRIYNSVFFGRVYLGLSTALRFSALVLYIVFIFVMKKKFQGKDTKASDSERKVMDEANLEFLNNGEHFVPSAGANSKTCNLDMQDNAAAN